MENRYMTKLVMNQQGIAQNTRYGHQFYKCSLRQTNKALRHIQTEEIGPDPSQDPSFPVSPCLRAFFVCLKLNFVYSVFHILYFVWLCANWLLSLSCIGFWFFCLLFGISINSQIWEVLWGSVGHGSNTITTLRDRRTLRFTLFRTHRAADICSEIAQFRSPGPSVWDRKLTKIDEIADFITKTCFFWGFRTPRGSAPTRGAYSEKKCCFFWEFRTPGGSAPTRGAYL